MKFPALRVYKPPWQRPNWKRSSSPDFELVESPSLDTHSSGDDPHGKDETVSKDPVGTYDYPVRVEEDEIRILRLLPGQDGESISVQLHHEKMSSSPKYTASSYIWGKRRASRAIVCGNHCIRIPLSLYRALAHLRHPLDSTDFWADAICINQNDEVEKSCQVRGMHAIFMRAERVIV
jgi:hypothetical protein